MKKLLLAMSILALGGLANATTLKIATVTPEGSQWMKDMRASAAEIKERTEGRVQIKYYGGGVMGNDAKVLSQIRIGRLQGGAFTPGALAKHYPDMNIYGMPMVFQSDEEAAYVRERLDPVLLEGLEEAGWKSFGFAAGGFAYIMSNTPVKTLEDLNGKKVWVPEGDVISYASMEAMDLSPVTLPLTDVLTGLQTGLIDIVAMSPIGALVLQWHTKVDYVTEMPLVYTLGLMVVDQKAWKKISADDQAIVDEVMKGTYRNFDKVNLADNRGARDALIKSGVESVPYDLDEIAGIKERLLTSNRELGEQGMFSLELYDRMMSLIDEYRSQLAAE